MPKVTLLICDDAVMYSTMLSAWLQDDADIEVVGTVSGADEAIERAAELRPDVVLLDHLVDGTDSSALAPRLRVSAPASAIVLTSGASDDLLAEVAAAADADGWVGKAASFDVLRTRVIEAQRAKTSDDPQNWGSTQGVQ